MPDDTPDRVAATLSGIRAEALGSIAYADDHTCPDVANSCSAHHALLLLAAVEAALKHHQRIGRHPDLNPVCGCSRLTWPCPEVAAITAALTGEEAGGGN